MTLEEVQAIVRRKWPDARVIPSKYLQRPQLVAGPKADPVGILVFSDDESAWRYGIEVLKVKHWANVQRIKFLQSLTPTARERHLAGRDVLPDGDLSPELGGTKTRKKAHA